MISVLVPVYNVEKYLCRCLDSILKQTCTDYEIVLVDDGSTDQSGRICDAYAAEHDCIRVIHQENAGLAQVRNVSLAAARGEYITFVDSDDAIEPAYLEVLLRDLQETGADISICSWSEVSDDGARSALGWDHKEKGFQVWDTQQAVNNLLYQKGIDNNSWGKLYTRDVLQGVVFPAGRVYEDIATTYQIFLKGKRICYRPEALYLYTCNTAGISQSPFKPRRMDLIDMAEGMYRDIERRFPEYRRAAQARLLRAYIHVYLQIPDRAEFKAYQSRVFAGIQKHCAAVAGDPQAKRGTRMAAMLACVHPVLLRWLSRFKNCAK
ncbi:MAG: glycosyltransferase [Clostridia bacterium]|nr:glycosyltransferase [Clostridia bacterium]